MPDGMGGERIEKRKLMNISISCDHRVVDGATAKAVYADPNSGRKRVIYIQEEARFVLVVKATEDGGELYATTFYRIHRDEALRDREVARLLRKAEKK